MTTLDPATPLGDLVDLHPELTRELERLGLDYCCGGRRSLAAACADAGLDIDATSASLVASLTGAAPAEWTAMGAAELVDHLEATHHRYLWDELPRLTQLVTKIEAVHAERHPELHAVARLTAAIRADLEPHLVKEERVLFPMVRELAAATDTPAFHCGTLRNPIGVMLREHDEVGAILAELRRVTNGYEPPADGCASYVACYAALAELELDTHLHIHKENDVLFPLVVRLESELAAAHR